MLVILNEQKKGKFWVQLSLGTQFVTQHSFAFYLDLRLCLFPASQQTQTEACWDPEVQAHDSSCICWCREGPSWAPAENTDELQVNEMSIYRWST